MSSLNENLHLTRIENHISVGPEGPEGPEGPHLTEKQLDAIKLPFVKELVKNIVPQ
jgi:hypothetical protein